MALVGNVPRDNLGNMTDEIAECAVPVVISVTPVTSVAQTFDFEEGLQKLMETVNAFQLSCSVINTPIINLCSEMDHQQPHDASVLLPTGSATTYASIMPRSLSAHTSVAAHVPAGKCSCQSLLMANDLGRIPSRFVFIGDRTTGLRFLVDRGAEIRVISSTNADRPQTSSSPLQAVKGSAINTYSLRSLTITIGLRHTVGFVHCM